MVFVALILSQITYVLSAWGRQLNRQLQDRLDAFLKRARKFGFCDENYTNLTRQMLGFLDLYKDQNIASCLPILAVLWS